jgi:hypothetical protein
VPICARAIATIESRSDDADALMPARIGIGA